MSTPRRSWPRSSGAPMIAMWEWGMPSPFYRFMAAAYCSRSLQAHAIQFECERSRLGPGGPDDGHGVAAIETAEAGERECELLPLGAGHEGLGRGTESEPRGEEHHLIGLAIALGPELDCLFRREIRRRHRRGAGTEHCARPGEGKTWQHLSRDPQSAFAAFGAARGNFHFGD